MKDQDPIFLEEATLKDISLDPNDKSLVLIQLAVPIHKTIFKVDNVEETSIIAQARMTASSLKKIFGESGCEGPVPPAPHGDSYSAHYQEGYRKGSTEGLMGLPYQEPKDMPGLNSEGNQGYKNGYEDGYLREGANFRRRVYGEEAVEVNNK